MVYYGSLSSTRQQGLVLLMDIAFAVNRLASYAANPSIQHCEGKVPGGLASEFVSSENKGSPCSKRDQWGTSRILLNLRMAV